MTDSTGSTRLHSLHPLSMLFSIGLAAKRLLLPGLIVLVLRPGGQYEIWLMILFVPAVIGGLAKYLSFRYRLGPDELIIREGIVTRNERHVPYARIQNIDLTRNPLHRIFGVAEARIETASGGKPEAVIRVLSVSAIDVMRDRVFRGDPDRSVASATDVEEEGVPKSAPVTRNPPDVMLELSFREVVLFGLISNRGMVVVAAAMAAMSSQIGMFNIELDEMFPKAWRWMGPVGELMESRILFLVLGALVLVVAALVLMRLLSVALAIFNLYGFILTRRGDDLRSEF